MQYGPVMIDIEGVELSSVERELLQHPRVGGVIFFTRNYRGIDSLKALVADIRETANKKPLLLTVDHEGGRVWRFTEGFTKLPPARHYGTLYDQDSSAGIALARNAGWIMAAELLDCGIDFSIAPVLDLGTGISAVVGDRAFHSDPAIVSILAQAFIEGMNTVGMSAIGKHFPGHGGCAPDSHIAQPVDPRSLETLFAEDIIPFKNLSAVLGGIMPAHIVYPAVDTLPAGFSKRWLQDILRKELQFEGVILSDCLSMKGAEIGDFVDRAEMALGAGCDMVILCQQKRDLVENVLENLGRNATVESSNRLQNLAGKFYNQTRVAQAKPVLSAL